MSSLTALGLQIDRFPTVLADIVSAEQSNIDSNIYTRDDELLGQLNNIIAERIVSLNEGMQAVYDAFNIAKAEGKQLDDLAALRNVRRQEATYSTGTQTFVTVEGTTIPATTILANPITNDRFITTASIVAATSASYRTVYTIVNVLNSTLYTITINGVAYTYTSDASATALEIVTGLKASIDGGSDTTVAATLDGNTLVLTATSSVQPINSSTITYIKASSVMSKVGIRSQVVGDIVAPANSITQLVTPLLGITSTYNEEALSVGRLEETDEELRVRIPLITATGSTGTIPSITSALLSNVEGVVSVTVIENVLAVPDVDGRPAHSYEVIVLGGTDELVAQEVWRTKPAGIGLYGNTLEIITDSVGGIRSVYFTRPVPVSLAIRVQYTTYDEEVFPLTGEDVIKAVVLEKINALGVNEDVIPLRLVGPIYAAVDGLDDLIIEVQVLAASGDTPVALDWQTTRLPISVSEYANINNVDIYIEDI